MNCQKASNLLSAYLDSELTPEERRLLRLHLLACTECADELHELEQIKVTLGKLSIVNVPAVLPWLRIHLAAAGSVEEPQPFVWQYPWFRRTCAVAALLLLFGLSSWLLSPQRQDGGPARQGPLPALPDANWVSFGRVTR